MSWNYRIIRRIEEYHESKAPVCSIASVFYDASGAVHTWSAEPIWPIGETPEELADDLDRMRVACARPVLDEVEAEDGVLFLRESGVRWLRRSALRVNDLENEQYSDTESMQ